MHCEPGRDVRNTKSEAGDKVIEDGQVSEPEQEIILAEQRKEVQDILRQMKPRSAQLLVLRYSGFTYAELAAVLKINPNSVGKMLARAQDEFETLFNQGDGG